MTVTHRDPNSIREHLRQTFEPMSKKALVLNSAWAKKQRERLSRYTSMLDTGDECCGYCFMNDIRDKHDPFDCPLMRKEWVRNPYRDFKRRLNFRNNNLCCFKCGVISLGGDVLHEDYRNPCKDDSCPRRNFVLGAIFWIMHEHSQWIWNRFGKRVTVKSYATTPPEDWKSFLPWLFGSDTEGGGDQNRPETRDGTNMFKMLTTYWHECYST